MYSDTKPTQKDTTKRLNAIDPEVVKELQGKAPSDETIAMLAVMFHVLGDPTRLKILYFLKESACCVRDLAILVGVSEFAISHQLRLLRDRQLVTSRREGTIIYYTLSNHHLGPLFQEAESHAAHIYYADHSHPSH